MKNDNNFEESENLTNNIKKFIPYTIKDILKMKFSKNPFLVESLIPEEGITIISGQPGSGKSWVAFHIVQCIASNKEVFGKFKTKKANILFIDGDTNFGEIQRRLKLMRFRQDRNIYIISEQDIMVDRSQDLERIINLIKEKNIGFIVLDPFVAFHDKDENISGEMKKVIQAVKKIMRKGTTVLIIHHHRKESENSRFHSAQNLRGSSAILGAIDSQIEVRSDRNNPKEIMVLSQHKARRSGSIGTFKIKMSEQDKIISFGYIGESFDNVPQRQKAEIHILDILESNKEMGFENLFDDNIAGETVFRDVLNSMEKDKKIKIRKIDHGKKLYSIILANPVS